jgi:uncharacterized membrane protein YeaQ/YmgE (transglycosylase-associated protein family)
MQHQLVFGQFLPWLWLAIIAGVVSAVWYFVLRIKSAGGYWFQLVVAWVGAWLGTPIFGDWGFLTFNGVCIIPSLIGAIAAVMLVVGSEKQLHYIFSKTTA